MIVGRLATWTTVVAEVRLPLGIFALESTAAVTLERYTSFFEHITIPDTALTLIGTAISILVSFRTATAYARWWEARTLWGGLANASRTLARQALAFGEGSGANPVAAAMRSLVLAQIAYVHALRRVLRDQDPVAEIDRVLGANAARRIAPSANYPARLLFEMGRSIGDLRTRNELDGFAWTRLDATLTDIVALQGGCERLKTTPLPRQYDIFPELFIYAYCFVLPIVLADQLKLLTPLVTLPVSFAFLIIDRFGQNLEDPFANRAYDTPLTYITQSIERVLREFLGDPEPVTVSPARHGVLM